MRTIVTSFTIFIVLLATSATLAEVAGLRNMTVMAENEYLRLFMNEQTTEFAVQDIQSERVWYSNPPDRNSDRQASVAARERMSAQFSLEYYVQGDIRRSKNNFNDSVKLDQFEIYKIPDGVRVHYTLGVAYADEALVPPLISKERLESVVLPGLERETDRKFLTDTLTLIWLEKTDRVPKSTHPEIDSEDLFGEYRLVSSDDEIELQKIRDLEAQIAEAGDDESRIATAQRRIDIIKVDMTRDRRAMFTDLMNRVLDTRDDVKDIKDLRPEHFSQLIDNPTYIPHGIPTFRFNRLMQLFHDSGYTIEDVNFDRLANNLGPVKPEIDVHKVPIEYVLDGRNLVVRIPVGEIDYAYQVVVEEDEPPVTHPLYRISLLPYFGASNGDSGYMFVPDGSGALIRFTEEKPSGRPGTYGGNVYGEDNAAREIGERTIWTEKVRMPVFGIADPEKALFAIIEDGEALAVIQAENAGRVNSYNSIRPEFIVTPVGETYLQTGQTKINTYQSRIYQGDIQVRYSFLTDDDATYSGMAREYQRYLVERYGWERLDSEDQIPLYVELVGAVDTVKPVMMIPRRVAIPLTTFDQAREILNTLRLRGVDEIKAIYTGWLAGGVDHLYPARTAIERALGSRRDWSNLIEFAEQQDIALYPEVGLLNVSRDTLFDGFRSYRDGARRLDRLTARVYDYHPATYGRISRSSRVVLSPSKLNGLVDRFLAGYRQFDSRYLALTYMGDQVNADFRRGDLLVDRQQALSKQTEVMKRLSHDEGLGLLVRGGLAYTLPFVTDVIESPLESTKYNAIDESVPFYQMVIHGYVDYAGTPLNFAHNRTEAVLKMVETGAAPYYRWFYDEPSAVKETEFDHLFAANYAFWLDEAVGIATWINQELGQLRNQTIIEHRAIKPGVFQTIYEQGHSVIVNYNKKDVDVFGHRVAGQSFKVFDPSLVDSHR